MGRHADIDWIPEGTTFGEEDLVHYANKGTRRLGQALADIDVVIGGPHASAALPSELADFVDPGFTRRLQYDFSDRSTSPLARRWAEIDPHVLYVENPHPRAVRDANRARPQDLIGGVREAFRRLASAGEGGHPSLKGVDAVRPVTFANVAIFREPTSEAEWARFDEALTTAGALGVDRYEVIRDNLIERVIEAKLARLATLDPAKTSIEEWNCATHLDVLSIHDTMNHTAQPNGALCRERAPRDRLPNVVSLANRGDANGEARIDEAPGIRAPDAVPTMAPTRLRVIANGYRQAFDAHGDNDVVFNRPYLGGYETSSIGPRLRSLQAQAVVRITNDPPRQLHFGAWQNEFLREFLLGDEAVATLMQPGTEWVSPPPDRINWLANQLLAAHTLVRQSLA